MGFFKDFKEFIMRGNVIDMAVGVVIGAAFGKIVTSLVNDIVMPPIGLAIGGVAFSELKATLKEPVTTILEDGTESVTEGVYIHYGNFIQTILEFIIIALCIFLVVRGINKLRNKVEEAKKAKEAAAAAEAAAAEEEVPAEPQPTEAELLAEIRDLLAKQQQQ